MIIMTSLYYDTKLDRQYRQPVSMCSNRESEHRHGTTYTHVYAALPYRAAESGHTPQVKEGVGMVSSGLALHDNVEGPAMLDLGVDDHRSTTNGHAKDCHNTCHCGS